MKNKIKIERFCIRLLAGLAVVFACFILKTASAKADYYAQGVLVSNNLLASSTVAQITGFRATSTVPASTTASVQFSQNNTDWYTSLGIKGGWDSVASGATFIELRALNWISANFYYRLKLETASSTLTPTVADIGVEYSDTYTPYTAPWDGGYYREGALLSTNLLTGKTDVAQITGFTAAAAVPASTTLSATFSQDQINWYNSQGIKGGWETLASGTTAVDITALDWKTAYFYYKTKFTSASSTETPTASEVRVDYSDTYTAPGGGAGYFATGTIASTDLLAGSGQNLTGNERFGYDISSMPAGTAVAAQFSRDNASWYNSVGTLWGWSSLSAGEHLNVDAALDLLGTGFATGTSFYYRLRLTTSNSSLTPVVREIRLLRREMKLNTKSLPTSTVRVNTPQVDRMTGGLVGIWSFNGSDISGATAFDRSSGGHNGTLTGGARLDSGQLGQAVAFDGTASYVSIGNVASGIKTVAFWMKAEPAVSRKIIDFDGIRQIEINSSSQIAATGFPAPIVYVNGVATTSVNTDWRFVAVTDTTGVNGTAVDLGRVGSNYFKGVLDEVRFYNIVLSPDEIFSLYRLGSVKIKR